MVVFDRVFACVNLQPCISQWLTEILIENFLPTIFRKSSLLIFVGLTEGKKHVQLFPCSLHAFGVRIASHLLEKLEAPSLQKMPDA